MLAVSLQYLAYIPLAYALVMFLLGVWILIKTWNGPELAPLVGMGTFVHHTFISIVNGLLGWLIWYIFSF
tara:strand:- start:1 stop:210 length:210 start_codon:yes stop_codon:yes gene_type:complete